jgi:hypothetical protein
MRSLLFLLSALVLAPGCASYTYLAADERATLERDLEGRDRERYLRVSMYVTPFFGDDSKRLLTSVPPDEVRLLNSPNGDPISPGPVQKILPAGRRARVLQVEFPTAWVVTERLVYTPRTLPWVYVAVEGEPNEPPTVVVLRPQIRSRQEFLADLERYLTEHDPNLRIAEFPATVQEAIRTKTAIEDMTAEALEMAWGYPERKRIYFEESVQKEEWFYPGEKRIAYLADGRVQKTVSPRAP